MLKPVSEDSSSTDHEMSVYIIKNNPIRAQFVSTHMHITEMNFKKTILQRGPWNKNINETAIAPRLETHKLYFAFAQKLLKLIL